VNPNRSRPGFSQPDPFDQHGRPGRQSNDPFGQPRSPFDNRVTIPDPMGSQRFGGAPSIPEPIRGPVFQNPFALRSQVPAHVDPVQAARVRLPVGSPMGPGWDEVNRAAASGNIDQLRQQIDRRLTGNPSLDRLMTAVTAMDRAAPGTANPYRDQARALAQRQVQAGVPQPLPWLATARFALEDQNDALFRQTTQQMLQRFPSNPQAHYFEGVRAAQDQDWKAAEKALLKARELGMEDESLAQLLKVAIDNQRWIWQYAKILTAVLVVWFLGLAVIVVVGRVLSQRTLRAIREDGHGRPTAIGPLTRSIYRWVVTAASLYYFISLPVMLVLAIALPLALAYALLMTPYLNLWLVGFVLVGGLGGILTALSGLRTAFVRIKDGAIGRSLRPAEAPQFWQLVREVARDVGTRPVDDIWIVPGVDMAVLERGTWRQKMNDTGQRVLLLGVGLLPNFRTDAMRAVLAHEYAHFIHRDTAGGDMALRVQAAMNRFIDAIVSRGPVRMWDITVQFLRFYVPLYYKLTLGASRLQEVLADRLAVERYGASALIDGFHHVVRRDVEFQHLTSRAVREAIRGTAATAAFYAPAKSIIGDDRIDLEADVRDALQQPTTDFDSHPGMGERIALARRVGVDRPVGEGAVILLFGEIIKSLARDMAKLITDDVKLQARFVNEHDGELLRKINRSLEVQPSVEALEARAAIYYRRGQVQQALDDLNAILTHFPGDLATVLSRSNLYESEKQFENAVEDLRQLKSRGNELPRDVRFGIVLRTGNCLMRLGRAAEAAAEFDEALLLAPNSLNAVLGRLQAAAAMKTLGGQDEQVLLKRAIETWPEMVALEPYVQAGGLAKLLISERKKHSVRAPGPAPQMDVAPQGGRWVLAGAVSAALLVGIGCVLWWSLSGDDETAIAAVTPAVQPPLALPVETAPADEANQASNTREGEAPAEPPASTDITHADPSSTTEQVAAAAVATPESSAEATTVAATETFESPEEALAESADVAATSAEEPVSSDATGETPDGQVASTEPPASTAEPAPSEPAQAAEPAEMVAGIAEPVQPAQPVRPERPRVKPLEPSLVKIPAVNRRAARRPSRATSRQGEVVENKLKQIAIAMMSYHDANRGFPVERSPRWTDAEGRPHLSWRVHLLPYFEENALYARFKLDEPWDSPNNIELLQYMPEVYRSSTRDNEKTRFLTVEGDHMIFGGTARPHFAYMTDGAVNTILLVQADAKRALPWTKPEDLVVEPGRPRKAWSRSARSIFCVMADASPLELPGNIPDDMLAALLTARGREVLDGQSVRRYSAQRRGQLYVQPEHAQMHETRKLKEVGIALLNFHDSHKQFPPAGPLPADAVPPPKGSGLSWRVHLLPYMEHRNLHQQFHLDEPWDSPHNLALAEHMPDIYRDSDDPVDSTTTRIMFLTGPGTPFTARGRRGPDMRQFRDGTSKTILAVQAGEESAVLWTKPDDLPFDRTRPFAGLEQLNPRVGLLVVTAGGAVKPLLGIDEESFRAMVTPNGGELVRAE
jgi:Zn-dependent protease with chaperone function/tetratricopeptide (TPR) repeat protein